MYLKNGPGTFKNMHHLFDGYGMLTKTRFDKGRAFFSSRFVQSDAYKAFASTGKPAFSEFGTPVGLVDNLVNTVKLLTGMGLGTWVDGAQGCIIAWGGLLLHHYAR